MSIFSKMSEISERQRNEERQKLLALSEKELLAEIILQLKDISKKCDDIKSNQYIYR